MPNFHLLISAWASGLKLYDRQEAESLVRWLFEHHLDYRRSDGFKEVDEASFPSKLFADFERVKTGEPIQYIFGKGPFYGRDFYVDSFTLIPRNETEELVHLIIKENSEVGLKILDIGTGTGCIPISLDLEMNTPEVFGVDISEEALCVANKNAVALDSKVTFLTCDILSQIPDVPKLDILISNPPYVLMSEKSQMHQNVLDFEPEMALFVSNDDPLLFYSAIANKGLHLLKGGGKLYFEINEKYGNGVVQLLTELGYSEVRLKKDLNGKDRMVKAIR
jgi:release factor glutamine methyltransferase